MWTNFTSKNQRKDRPYLIAGPCSVETEEQLDLTVAQIAQTGVANMLRGGIWKPRTRPGSFEGVGEEGLQWLVAAGKRHQIPVSTEVANAYQTERALKAGVDVLWIGARTTVNPFSVQEIADSLQGVDIPVMVKNPVNPDLELWIGAFERLQSAGITRLAAIHRGFSSSANSSFRNDPQWQIPIELQSRMPGIPLICDPSHIAGNRELIPFISQKAMDLNMTGLMVETHFQPAIAWSDARQQLTPQALGNLVSGLIVRNVTALSNASKGQLEILREQIDALDDQLLQLISERMKISEKIGHYKKENGVTILQLSRWEEIIHSRLQYAKAMGLDTSFTDRLLKVIHQGSIDVQTLIMNQTTEMAK
jgi:chorismate mutase